MFLIKNKKEWIELVYSSAQEVETGRLSFQGPAEHTVRIKEEKLKTYSRAGAGVLDP